VWLLLRLPVLLLLLRALLRLLLQLRRKARQRNKVYGKYIRDPFSFSNATDYGFFIC
jgi:hypothetical protein